MIRYIEEDTIAAISTPKGSGAISIVRLSGSDAFSIVSKLFITNIESSKNRPRMAIHGHLIDGKKKIDEIIMIRYAAPSSFTGEDMVEINCHGGRYITMAVLDLLLKSGARLAEPGEFTKRAFLNNKIDLIQAESIQEMIGASSNRAIMMAMQGLDGKISNEIKILFDRTTDILAKIDVSIDYPEYEQEELTGIEKEIEDIKKDAMSLIATYKKGSLYKNGIKISIIGRPNVGKSTFLNAFIGKNRAIVTDIPGTTRDTIEETLEIGGIAITLIDTAGIRDTDDVIEKIGQGKTKEAIKSSEMILYMLDPNEKAEHEVIEIINEYPEKHVIIVLNKVELTNIEDIKEMENKIKHPHVIKASLINNQGINEIEKTIKEILLLDETENDEVLISSARHKENLLEAINEINKAIDEIKACYPIDIYEISLRSAARYLSNILGNDADTDINDKIFSKFCLGK